MMAGGGTRFTGETEAFGTPLEALSVAKAKADLLACPTASANGLSFICYTQPDRHSGGANYIYADGHAKWAKLEATLNPLNYQWGKRFYAHGSVVYQPGTTTPVQ
jgi:prepilin-type processing-associated H-X9-DG protein